MITMKKWIALMLSFLLVFNLTGMMIAHADEALPDFIVDEDFDFDTMDDPAFLQYLEDSVYANLEAQYAESGIVYQIEAVSVKYISKEYLEETEYNTKANIFFGYTLDQINEAFQGEKYVFTLSDTGETVVQEFIEMPDDTYDRVIKNVLIGAGIILICVTVSVVTAGAAAPAAVAGGTSAVNLAAASTAGAVAKVNMIFTASAKTAAAFATKGAFFAGATTLVTRGIETGWDTAAMTESAALESSEAFKCGAIAGAVVGGGKEALRIHRISRGPISPREAEQAALEYYGGREQVSYLNGEEVSYSTAGSVRPDVLVGKEAIEVKCYDLTNKDNLYNLQKTLTTEISQRVHHLPDGMTQRIVLNVEGRGYTTESVERVVAWIEDFMEPIYPDIPIDVMGAML